jgi:hypothetical protein
MRTRIPPARWLHRAGISCVLAMGAPAALGAQQCEDGEATVVGQVHDAATRVPLVGAAVSVAYRPEGERRDRTFSGETGLEGRFHFCDVPAGVQVRVQAKYGGDSSAPHTVFAGAGESLRITLQTPGSVVLGRVTDGADGSAISNVSVRLADTPLETLSGSDGRFRFARVPPGSYALVIEHLGYGTVQDSVDVELSSTVDVAVTMNVAALPLAPLQVTTRSFHLERVGFYTRRERFSGGFISRDELPRRPTYASDMLRTMAGIRLAPRRNSTGSMPIGRGNCGFRYIVDGARIGPFFEIDDLRADWIEAIEVYRGVSEIPGEFHAMTTDPRGNCGVIVVWTRVR